MSFAIDASRFDAAIGKVERVWADQIPFAISRTINALAYKTQQDTIKRLLPEKFLLRTDWWKPGRKTGVNYFPSHKKKHPIKAIVNTLAWFMQLQESGGTKKPRSGDPFVAIPTWNAQPTRHEQIRPNRRYRRLIKYKHTLTHRGSPWIGSLRNGKPSVAVRLTSARLPIAVMYIGKDSVQIKPRFGFRENAQKIVDANFDSIFANEFANAVATAH